MGPGLRRDDALEGENYMKKTFKKLEKMKSSEIEQLVLKYWQSSNIFQKSIDQRPKEKSYVFYDGPPFITGLPHYGNLLPSFAKDGVNRFWTMKGYRVERKWGWDCHGLPAENYVEKKLGIKDKRGVAEIGLEKYIETCHESMVQVGSEWEDTVDRIGRWVDFKGAYKTMDNNYMESVWWAFKTLHERGKIYEGEKVLMYCTRCATPISKSEVAMDNSYQDVTDPSVYVQLKLVEGGEVRAGVSLRAATRNPETEPDLSGSRLPPEADRLGRDDNAVAVDLTNASLLAWTTTPWTLNANVAAAVNADLMYSLVEHQGERFILATEAVERVFKDEKHQPLEINVVNNAIKGSDLIGLRYVPLFADRGENAHRVIAADYVSHEAGSGVVHLAPGYGEEDYVLGKKEGLPIVFDVDDNGNYIEGRWTGSNIWEVNKDIAKQLKEEGVVWKIDYVTHSYPHCHRCATKLMYKAHPSWFMDIDGQRDEMLKANQDIDWYPGHIKDGRFAKTVESAPDWNLSRDRFWATPIPVWRGITATGEVKTVVVGSFEELEKLSGKRLDDYHRPYVDEVKFTLKGVEYTRIDKVLDCWFESGSMPFAQFHYPFENVQKFEDNFPCDFIVEYVGQVRAWFYYLHAISVGLFGKQAFRNVIVTGTIAGNDGRKMSKSLGNYTDPNILMDRESADALRLNLLGSSVMKGEDYSLLDRDVTDRNRRLATLLSTLDFFLMYAEADNWQYDETLLFDPQHILDKWLLATLTECANDVEKSMEAYDTQSAVEPLMKFIDSLSNWYVRRSRRRFWRAQHSLGEVVKGDDDSDKNDAYATLRFVLVEFSKVLAPFAPFHAEHVYRTLTGEESVHLVDWPNLAPHDLDAELVEGMNVARELITKGLAMRAKAGVKVRQPLASASIQSGSLSAEFADELLVILSEELNVKKVYIVESVNEGISLDTELTPELKSEGLAREIIRVLQELRKSSGLNVEDRIDVDLFSESQEIIAALQEHKDLIAGEVLAVKFEVSESSLDAGEATKVGDVGELEVRLVKNA
jgi:isoleucyl-tRNA synthetase